MNKYLLDTDIIIFFLQGKYELKDKIEAVGFENCFISEITIAELLFGAENSQDINRHLKEVEEIEQRFNIIPIYSNLKTYAKEKVRLRKKGTPLAEFDLLIGTTSIAENLIMVTGNEKHFKKIDGLKVENWTNKSHNSFL